MVLHLTTGGSRTCSSPLVQLLRLEPSAGTSPTNPCWPAPQHPVGRSYGDSNHRNNAEKVRHRLGTWRPRSGRQEGWNQAGGNINWREIDSASLICRQQDREQVEAKVRERVAGRFRFDRLNALSTGGHEPLIARWLKRLPRSLVPNQMEERLHPSQRRCLRPRADRRHQPRCRSRWSGIADAPSRTCQS